MLAKVVINESAEDRERDCAADVSTARLLKLLPPDQVKAVMSYPYCDINPSFLGFVDIYEHLSFIIPRHFAVVDLGCAFAAQSFFFEKHAKYIGVDLLTKVTFQAKNAEIHHMPIAHFLEKIGPTLDLKRTFAVCSYVPPWHGDNGKLAREFFPNIFAFYPG